MRTHTWQQKSGITRAPEFTKKLMADFAVNCGLKCGHDCLYCSTGAMLRAHRAFKILEENPFCHGYAIIDPTTPDRVAEDARRMRRRGLVHLCTTVDAWAPEAKQYNIVRGCLQGLMSQQGGSVRVLTKNAAIMDDFDLIEEYRDRILVGLSITATPEQDEIINIIEPNASSIQDRMLIMVEAAARGLRTYAMLCPLLPGIADGADQIDQLVKLAVDCRVDEIFVEPVNPRGPGLKQCQEALELWGYDEQGAAVGRIRSRANWSKYVLSLLHNAQRSVRKYSDVNKLRFLLYPSRLLPEDLLVIRADDAGVVWLKNISYGKPRKTIKA